MALVTITEESLREQAGDGVFEQALAMADKVAGLSADGPLIEAAVDGIPVSVRIGPRGIDARCGCPAPGPCPHAVAVALAWVRTGEDEQVTDLFETLRALDRDWLARQLAELAAGDPVLSARLLEAAADADAAGAAARSPICGPSSRRNSAGWPEKPATTSTMTGGIPTPGTWRNCSTKPRFSSMRHRMRSANSPITQDLAAVHVRRSSKPGYLEAIKYLKMAQGLAERAGGEEDFRAFMTELRAAHPGKKVLHQQLSEAGLP